MGITVTTGGPISTSPSPDPMGTDILSIIQQVAPVIGLRVPTAVLGSTEREHIELSSLANEMAQRIAFDLSYDWSVLKRYAEFTGDGASESFLFPDDYRRMLKKARLWPSAYPQATLSHYPDSDQWLGMEVQKFQSIIGGWTIIGDRVYIKPVVGNGASVKFFYISTQIVKDSTGTPKSGFTSDDDTFILDNRILKLGMIWQWKANKGQQYAEDLSNYEDALSAVIGGDKGSNIFTVGRQRYPGAEMAFPGVIAP
jgi:hypothetical protein